jgi:hypothetical protein
MAWINANVPAESSCTILSCIARYDLGAYLAIIKHNFFKNRGDQAFTKKEYRQMTADIQEAYHPVLNRSAVSILGIFTEYVRLPIAYVYHSAGTWVKFFFLACMADPEYQRELNGALLRTPRPIAKLATFVLTGLWIYSRATMSIALPYFLYHRRKDIAGLAGTVKGSLIIQKKNRLIVRSYGDTETAFIHPVADGGVKLMFYQGDLELEPTWGHLRVTYYDEEMRITLREEYKNGTVANEFVYEYASKQPQHKRKISKVKTSRVPLSRICRSGQNEGAKVTYNRKGHIESGSYISHENLVRFKYHYRKNAKYDDELLRAWCIVVCTEDAMHVTQHPSCACSKYAADTSNSAHLNTITILCFKIRRITPSSEQYHLNTGAGACVGYRRQWSYPQLHEALVGPTRGATSRAPRGRCMETYV